MVAIPGFLSSILGLFSPIFGVIRRRPQPQQTVSEKHMDDVGWIMDDNYYKRDMVIAGKKMSSSPYLRGQLNAVRDIGHIAWLGGPAVAKFASSYLMEFSRILADDETPLVLKVQTLYAIIEMCMCERGNQDKARWSGLLETLQLLLGSPKAVIRRGATACLVVLVNDNYDNHMTVATVENIKVTLLRILQDDWRGWKRNEAARLILMLGLNRVDDNGEPAVSQPAV